jgi:hypothetical protein
MGLDSIPTIQNALDDIGGTFLVAKTDFKCHGLLAISSPVWAALGIIFDCGWFERLWALQEVILARNLKLYMEPYTLD